MNMRVVMVVRLLRRIGDAVLPDIADGDLTVMSVIK